MVKNYDTVSAYTRDKKGKAVTEDVKSVVEPLFDYVEESLADIEEYKSKLNARVSAIEQVVDALNNKEPEEPEVSLKDIESLIGVDNALRADIRDLNNSVNTVSTLVSSTASNLSALQDQLPINIAENIVPIQNDVVEIDARVENLESKIVSIDDWKAPVDNLNSQISLKASNESVQRIQSEVTILRADVNTAKTLNEQRYNALSESVQSLEGTTSEMLSKLDSQRSTLEEIQSTVTLLPTTSTLDTKITQSNSELQRKLTSAFQTADINIQRQLDDLKLAVDNTITLQDVDSHLSEHNQQVDRRLSTTEDNVSSLSSSLLSINNTNKNISSLLNQTAASLGSLSSTVDRNYENIIEEVASINSKTDNLAVRLDSQSTQLAEHIQQLDENTSLKFTSYYTRIDTDKQISRAINKLNLDQKLYDTKSAAVTEAVTQVLGGENITESYDTLKEIVDVIESDIHGAAGLLADVTDLKQFKVDTDTDFELVHGRINAVDSDLKEYRETVVNPELSRLATAISTESINRSKNDNLIKEEFDNKIGTIPTEKRNLSRWINDVETTLSDTIGDVDALQSSMPGVYSRIEDLEAVTALPEGKTSIARWVKDVEVQLTNTKEDLKIAKQTATASATALGGQIAVLQTGLTNVQTTVGNEAAGLVKDVNTLKTAVGIDDPSGEALSTRVSALDSGLSALSSLVGKKLPDDYVKYGDIISWLENLANDFDSKMFPLTIADVECTPSICTTNAIADINLTWTLSREPQIVYVGSPDAYNLSVEQLSGGKLKYTTTLNDVTRFTELPEIYAKHRAVEVTDIPEVTFTNYIYYWTGVKIEDDAATISLPVAEDGITPRANNGKFCSSVNTTVTLTAGEDKYCYFAFPESYDEPQFTVGIFTGGVDKLPVTASVIDNGTTVNYKIYRSTQPNLGKTEFKISKQE